MHNEFTLEQRIAYFTMEIALRSEIPTYSGGLGILAGDTIRSGADLELPLVAVSLVSRAGYFRQEIDGEGRQVEHPDPWDPAGFASPLDAKVAVTIEGREVWVRAWLHVLKGHMNGREPVILLDTDLDENRADDREITHRLYGGDLAYRLKQEIVLGIGGVRMLQALGFAVRQYHMNEGHSALLALELLRRYAHPPEGVRAGESPYDIPRVREWCNLHHAYAGGGRARQVSLRSRANDARRFRRPRDPEAAGRRGRPQHDPARRQPQRIRERRRQAPCRSLARVVPGLSRACGHQRRASRTPGPAGASSSSTTPTCRAGVTSRSCWSRADRIPDAAIWGAHVAAKAQLIEKVRALTGVDLHPKLPILGFARRMTAYKRADLLFSDLERIRSIAQERSFQVVLAGKAHPRDDGWQGAHRHAAPALRELAPAIRIAYLPDYDMDIARAHGRRCRRLAEHAAAAAGGLRHQRHEGRLQRRAAAERAGRLVGRGLHRGRDRLGGG